MPGSPAGDGYRSTSARSIGSLRLRLSARKRGAALLAALAAVGNAALFALCCVSPEGWPCLVPTGVVAAFLVNHAHRAWSSCVHVSLDARVLRVRFAPRARPAVELDPHRVRALRQIDDAVLVDAGAVPDVLLDGVRPEQARYVAELLAAALAIPVATRRAGGRPRPGG